MPIFKLTLPSMGEGVMEATVTKWLKNEGESIEVEESIVEVATDKVDSDVPSEVSGIIKKILKNEGEVIAVGEAFAEILIEGEESDEVNSSNDMNEIISEIPSIQQVIIKEDIKTDVITNDEYNLSPLVKSIVKEENITQEELNSIIGTGLEGRITKEDIKVFLNSRDFKSKEHKTQNTKPTVIERQIEIQKPATTIANTKISVSADDEIIEMDRMRSLISNYMVESKKISPHVTSFLEADVTHLVLWREKNKKIFEERYGEKLTFTPLFIHAIVRAIKDFPMINISVIENKIIKKKSINIGVATALPSGNLIVPVVKNADQLSVSGLAKSINDLVNRARKNELKPSDITEGTYTITNIGTFGNVMGTPIINQPQVAIMAVGAILKKVSVIETPIGDTIGIRHKMYLSHTYDHRVVDGSLGGMFLKRVSDYLEAFDLNTEV